MQNLRDTKYTLAPQSTLALVAAGTQAREKLSSLLKAGTALDNEYSRAKCRHELALTKAEHRSTLPRDDSLRNVIKETKANDSIRSRFSRAVADCRSYDLAHLGSTGGNWARKVLLLNWLMVDETAHLLDTVCEFQRLEWDAASRAGEAKWQGRQVTASNFLDGKWFELVNLALARLGWATMNAPAEHAIESPESEGAEPSATEITEKAIKERLPEKHWDQVLGQHRALSANTDEYVPRSELITIGVPPTTIQKYCEKLRGKLPTRGGKGQGERSWERAGVLRYIAYIYVPRTTKMIQLDSDT